MWLILKTSNYDDLNVIYLTEKQVHAMRLTMKVTKLNKLIIGGLGTSKKSDLKIHLTKERYS